MNHEHEREFFITHEPSGSRLRVSIIAITPPDGPNQIVRYKVTDDDSDDRLMLLGTATVGMLQDVVNAQIALSFMAIDVQKEMAGNDNRDIDRTPTSN